MRQFPALYYGLYILIGAAVVLAFSWVYLFPLMLLAYIWRERAPWGLALAAITALYTWSLYEFPEEEQPVAGKFQIDSVSVSSSPFNRSYLYQGKLGKTPCRFFVPLHKPRPPANADLAIVGTLVPKGPYHYVLKNISWTPLEGSWRMAEMRYQCKEKVHRILERRFPDKTVQAFLASMITGSIDDRTLALQFQKVGLQHILGVSGFQFVLLAGLLGTIFRLFLPYRFAAALLLGCMTLYFVFLGDSPPVMRAYVAIAVFLVGIICNKTALPLNALGAALIVEVLREPLVITHIGFQLSFLCTFAILFFYPVFRQTLAKILPIRPFREARRLKLWDQHGHLLAGAIRESLALNGAVHLLALPVLLALFHRFPLLSLAYNLFFPAGATLAYLLCLFGCVLPGIDGITEAFTSGLLKAAADPPALADFVLRTRYCSFEITVLFLTAVIGWQLTKHPWETRYRCPP